MIWAVVAEVTPCEVGVAREGGSSRTVASWPQWEATCLASVRPSDPRWSCDVGMPSGLWRCRLFGLFAVGGGSSARDGQLKGDSIGSRCAETTGPI